MNTYIQINLGNSRVFHGIRNTKRVKGRARIQQSGDGPVVIEKYSPDLYEIFGSAKDIISNYFSNIAISSDAITSTFIVQ